jgi:hypothetical protein
VALAASGALGIAWVLPSPDRAVPGLWASGLALAVTVGAARYSWRLVPPLAGLSAALLGAVGLLWWLVGGWPLAAIAGAALIAGRLGGGPQVLTFGPIWLADRLTGGT